MKNGKKKRISLVNGKYLLWTTLILIGVLVLLCAAYAVKLFDNFIGYLIMPFIGLFAVYTAYEAFVLAFEGIRIGSDGIVVAGKDQNGRTIHFELDQLMCIYPCDQKGKQLPEVQEKYENIGLAFELKNGSKKIRQTSRLTKKQLENLRDQLGVHYASKADRE